VCFRNVAEIAHGYDGYLRRTFQQDSAPHACVLPCAPEIDDGLARLRANLPPRLNRILFVEVVWMHCMQMDHSFQVHSETTYTEANSFEGPAAVDAEACQAVVKVSDGVSASVHTDHSDERRGPLCSLHVDFFTFFPRLEKTCMSAHCTRLIVRHSTQKSDTAMYCTDRKARNRESAKRSRRRKLHLMHQLHQDVLGLRLENQQLLDCVQEARRQAHAAQHQTEVLKVCTVITLPQLRNLTPCSAITSAARLPCRKPSEGRPRAMNIGG
jgi:hypothetical protein